MRNTRSTLRRSPIVLTFALFTCAAVSSCKRTPSAGPEAPPAVVETGKPVKPKDRGAYLVRHVLHCFDCHSTRDWGKFAGPPVQGTEGAGRSVPGRLAPNITPVGISSWSDEQIGAAVRRGVLPDGKEFRQHGGFAGLCQSDLRAVVRYVRSIERRPLLKHQSGTEPATRAAAPDAGGSKERASAVPFANCPDNSDRLAVGKYLATLASCIECHVAQDEDHKSGVVTLAGGKEFPFPTGGTVRSPNISPHDKAGIGRWATNDFVARFRAYTLESTRQTPIKKGSFNTVMPWWVFSGMTDFDLSAIFAYLNSLPAADHVVTRWSPP